MERANSFWQINGKYDDVKEFHFSSPQMSFIAFFKDEKIIFVIDDTCDVISPNELLLIEPLEGEQNPKNPETKWDSILKNKFGINPMEIRPKENTKYKKLDISYTSLDLYASFASLQTEELLNLIEQNREILSLENAYEREAENLLVYNKSTTTLEKAQITLEKLQKRILNISKKMKNQEEREQTNPESIDEQAKAELMQKLYLATEKLKRTERRIKRANKRAEASFNELAAKRQQIAEIKRRIDEQNQNMEVQEHNLEENEPKYMPLPQQSTSSKEEIVIQESQPPQIEKLTFENNNATNRLEEEKEQTFLTKESTTMVKETENKKVQENQEFKPPYVDDTAMEQQSSDIRFAKKTNVLLDDKYKKIWMYSVSILVSLIVVFGIFYFISGDTTAPVNEDVYNTNYIEQNYNFPEDTVKNEPVEPAPVVEEYIYEQPEEVKPAPIPVKEEVKKAEPVSKPVVAKPVKKATPVKKASTPVAKKTSTPAPVEKEVVVFDDDVEEDDIDYQDDEEDDEEEEDEEDLSPLEQARNEFVENVIDDDAYINLINEVSNNYFGNDTNLVSLLEKLNEMNGYWNAFRNVSYDTYYESDYSLKPDIDYEEYAEDEHLLRLYTNKYFEMYEYLVNEFVMTYEYANGTASDLYPVMEEEMQILGKPTAKLQILIELYNSIQKAGGPSVVLEDIEARYEEELRSAPEIEATLIPLESTTTVVVNDETIYNDGSSATTSYTEEEYDDDLLVNSENSLDDDEEEYAEEDDEEELTEVDDEDEEEFVDSEDEELMTDEELSDNSLNEIQEVLTSSIAENIEQNDIEEEVEMSLNNNDEEELIIDEDDEESEDEYADSDEDDEYFDDEDEEEIEYSESNEFYEEEYI
ncbi:hypothetical protein HDR59_03860 [bacterium]|nr:hypothetical protein [bacterium]